MSAKGNEMEKKAFSEDSDSVFLTGSISDIKLKTTNYFLNE
jgi:hypothetical protein